VTVITRKESSSTFPAGLSVVRTDYSLSNLTDALAGQDAAVAVVGPAGIHLQSIMVDAAEAAGVKRFIIDDFGWGPNPHSFPEFANIHDRRRKGWDHAEERAKANPAFTWTGITTGNPIDWVGRPDLQAGTVQHALKLTLDIGHAKILFHGLRCHNSSSHHLR
jgi:hypothetical protein